jgi:hypothetical protein
LKCAQVIPGNWRAIVLCGALAAMLLGACGGRATATAPPTGLAKVTPTATMPTVLTARVPGDPNCPGDRPRDPLSVPSSTSAPSLPQPLATGAVPTLPRPPTITASRTPTPCPSVTGTPAAAPTP